VLLHNPSSGDEDHAAEELAELVRAAGHELDYQSTTEPGWERALERTADLVAVAGGDGTVGQVLRALAEGPRRLFTVVPLGSANNIAKTFGLCDLDPEALVESWATAETRRFRLGEMTCGDRGTTFLEAVGGGLLAETIEVADRSDPEGGDEKVDHGLRVMRALVEELPSQPWHVELDGADRSGDYLAVEAMVIGETGPNIPLAPAADPEDRLLDVVLVTDDDRVELLAYLDARLEDRDGAAPALAVHRCERATLRPPPARPLRIDDELWHPEPGREDWDDVEVRTRVTLDVLTPTDGS
jgi:diacylglycerol kinase family enzyme